MSKPGLYNKFKIEKTDGTPIDEDAEYFVLNIAHDQHAAVAIYAYALSVREENAQLAYDLLSYFSEHWGEDDSWSKGADELIDLLERYDGVRPEQAADA